MKPLLIPDKFNTKMDKRPLNDILLTYTDITIRQKDLDCLQPRCWLNDICIAFYFQYLKETSPNDQVFLMDPAVSALLLYEDDPELIFFGVDLSKFKVFIIPINDNSDKMNANAGSHWSLLIFPIAELRFVYYDSMLKKSTNISNALKIASKLLQLVPGKASKDITESFLIEKETPQQSNGYDCGVYVLGFTEVLLGVVSRGAQVAGNKAVGEIVSQEYVNALRSKVRELLNNLINSQKF